MAKKEDCPSKELSRAKEISTKYKQLSNCCDILSKVKNPDCGTSLYGGGWRIYESDIIGCGVDIDEEVYDYIAKLIRKRRLELELELEKVE